jgi:hypothetical protein
MGRRPLELVNHRVARLYVNPLAMRWSAQALPDRIQEHYRNLALGFPRVVSIGRPELQCLFPQAFPLRAANRPGLRSDFFRPDLDLDLRVGDEVPIPARVFRRATFGCDDNVKESARLC